MLSFKILIQVIKKNKKILLQQNKILVILILHLQINFLKKIKFFYINEIKILLILFIIIVKVSFKFNIILLYVFNKTWFFMYY